MAASRIGSFALAAIRAFCSTLDTELELHHAWINPDDLKGISNESKALLECQVLEVAKMLWPLMSNYKSSFPSDHCIYVKLFAESRPALPYDYILFDEAQDADRLMLEVIQQQNSQLIWVGDEYQQIYAWRGAVNAMQKIETDNTVFLTQSFRFGQSVADIASGIIKTLGCKQAIRGNPTVKSRIEKLSAPNAILCRTNAAVAAELFKVPVGLPVATTGLAQSKEFFRSYEKLVSGQKPSGSYALFDTLQQLEEHSASPGGSDLRPYFKLLKNHSLHEILGRLESTKEATTIDERLKSSSLIISTAHRAKGLEYKTVRLAEDFRTPSDEKAQPKGEAYPIPPTDEQMRLLYVAATRAIDVLDPFDIDLRFLGKRKPNTTTATPQTCFEGMEEDRERHDFASTLLVQTPKKQTKNSEKTPKTANKAAENRSNTNELDRGPENRPINAIIQKTDFHAQRKEAVLDVRGGMTVSKAMTIYSNGLEEIEVTKLRAALEAVASTM